MSERVAAAPEPVQETSEVRVRSGETVVVCRPTPPPFGPAGTWTVEPEGAMSAAWKRSGNPRRAHRDQRAATDAAAMLARELERIRLQRERLLDDEVAFLDAYALDPALGRALSGG